MLRELSVFTGATDIRQSLGLLMRTAAGLERTSDNSAPLDSLAPYLSSAAGRADLERLAGALQCPIEDLPDSDTVMRLFDDERLSNLALKNHRGRNVYSAGKAELWSQLWLPFRDALTPDDATLQLLKNLISMKTHDGGEGVDDCVEFLHARLSSLGFDVEVFSKPKHTPLILARRSGRGSSSQLALYSHYDVEEPDIPEWVTDPWVMTEKDTRLFGVGIGDNKAVLAHRLVLLEELDQVPEIVWVIQGEEEVHSPLARELLPELTESLNPVIWVEENGYFDLDGTQRMLARTIGEQSDSSEPPDELLLDLIGLLGQESARFGIGDRLECRSLNKSFFEDGCPFNHAIPRGGRYIAIGVNDPASNIHAPNESVPMWTFPVHARQFNAMMSWAARQGPE